MAKTAAYQLQKSDIRVNSICPGLIETGMTGSTFEYARQRGSEGKIGQLNALGRYGVPEGEHNKNIPVDPMPLGSGLTVNISPPQKLPMQLFS